IIFWNFPSCLKLVLKPDMSTVTDPITSILWKNGKMKVAEWDKDFVGLDIYAAFKGHTTLDQTTGELRVTGLMKPDSGVYSVEFNSKLLDKTYTLSVSVCVCVPNNVNTLFRFSLYIYSGLRKYSPPWHFSYFVALQPGIKIDFWGVCIILIYTTCLPL
uniref:Immunoglobulin V-set domain-containing protein n=1 Tax=Salmo trutta TaxID=8032 RepID=A0A673YEX4_SALTR